MSRKKKGLLHRTRLNVGDKAVLYVGSCSDVNPWLQYNRGFTECVVISVIQPTENNKDTRYIIACAMDLRDEPLFGGLERNEAIVSDNSVFLMTTSEYERYMNDLALLIRLLAEYEKILNGNKIAPWLRSWQTSTLAVVSRLGVGVDKVLADIRYDFLPETRKELVKFDPRKRVA